MHLFKRDLWVMHIVLKLVQAMLLEVYVKVLTQDILHQCQMIPYKTQNVSMQ